MPDHEINLRAQRDLQMRMAHEIYAIDRFYDRVFGGQVGFRGAFAFEEGLALLLG